MDSSLCCGVGSGGSLCVRHLGAGDGVRCGGGRNASGKLIKGGAALEALARVRIVALDKTGTLTRNEPRVVETVSANGAGKCEILSLAAALEAQREHPLGQAILRSTESFPRAVDVKAVPGSGLLGIVDGSHVRLGRPGFVEAGDARTDVERMQEQGSAVVLVERSGTSLGAIAVRDDLREAPEVVRALLDEGYRVVMLTGDNRRTAEALASQAGIDEVFAELLPEDKARILSGLSADSAVNGWRWDQ